MGPQQVESACSPTAAVGDSVVPSPQLPQCHSQPLFGYSSPLGQAVYAAGWKGLRGAGWVAEACCPGAMVPPVPR